MVHMHAANVLHSDLKARNIMLKSSGVDGRGFIAKVWDKDDGLGRETVSNCWTLRSEVS